MFNTQAQRATAARMERWGKILVRKCSGVAVFFPLRGGQRIGLRLSEFKLTYLEAQALCNTCRTFTVNR